MFEHRCAKATHLPFLTQTTQKLPGNITYNRDLCHQHENHGVVYMNHMQ